MTDEIKNLSKEIAKELSEPERGDMPPDGDWPRQDYIGNTSVNKGEKGKEIEKKVGFDCLK